MSELSNNGIQNYASLEQLVKLFNNSTASEKYDLFVQILEFPFEDIADTIFDAMQDNSHRIRSVAARNLGKKGTETIVPRIIQLLYDDSLIIRLSAQEALTNLSPQIAIPAFRGLLSSPTGDPGMRKNMASVLAKYDVPEAESILIQMYKDASDEDLKTSLVDFIGEKESNEALNTLFTALGDDSWKVRNTAIKSISKFDIEKIIHRAVELLSNQNRIVHMAIVEVLSNFDSEVVIDEMADILNSENILSKVNAINVLVGINNDESIAMIVSALNDKSATVRNRAIDALAHVPSKQKVLELVKRCMKSSNWNLRQGSIKVLAIIGTEEAVDLLEELIKEDNVSIRISVLEGLAKIESRRCIRIITEYISLSDIGEDAIRIIESLDPDKAVIHLVSFLTDDTYFSRTVSAMKNMDKATVQRTLASKITKGTALEKIKAVQAMGIIGGPETEKYLNKLIEDNPPEELLRTIREAIELLNKKIK